MCICAISDFVFKSNYLWFYVCKVAPRMWIFFCSQMWSKQDFVCKLEFGRKPMVHILRHFHSICIYYICVLQNIRLVNNNCQGEYSPCGKWGLAIYWVCGSVPSSVTVLCKWFCILLSHVLKCTAVYILAFMCGLVGVFRREVLSWLFDKMVIYRLGVVWKAPQLAKFQENNPVKSSSQKLLLVVVGEGPRGGKGKSYIEGKKRILFIMLHCWNEEPSSRVLTVTEKTKN